ncbi:MAG: DUF2492 family protein [Mesorhizobium sp.]|nr:MAG: DUF2492 family protein [Mesorhizobium sp.]
MWRQHQIGKQRPQLARRRQCHRHAVMRDRRRSEQPHRQARHAAVLSRWYGFHVRFHACSHAGLSALALSPNTTWRIRRRISRQPRSLPHRRHVSPSAARSRNLAAQRAGL